MEMDIQCIANDLTDGLIVVDDEGIVRLFNKKAREIAGLSMDKIIEGLCILNFAKETPAFADLHQYVTGRSRALTNKIYNINNYTVMCSIFRMEQNGKLMGAVLKLEDLTNQIRLRDEKNSLLSKIRKNAEFTTQEGILPKLVGESYILQYVKHISYKAALSNSNILLLGESGTGKSVLAESIHKASDRKNQPFISINCGAIPESLMESELFGYEEGAFTGARKEGRIGYFELADKGTLFLDEIGDMSNNMQVKLLSVIQNRKFMRIGGSTEKSVDIRIITATNKDLVKLINNGKFREDLYYRINVLPIYIPPLRERKEDIYLLVHALLPQICLLLGRKEKVVSPDAMSYLLTYDWPGNIRQLENVLERAINICEGDLITRQDVHLDMVCSKAETMANRPFSAEKIQPLCQAVDDFEKEYIENTLQFCNNDKNLAMQMLKIAKTTFYKKLIQYKIASKSD